MKPELRENSTFLRYNEIWRINPSSIVFVPLAELLIMHKSYEDAVAVCKKGLERNPDLVSGHLTLARALFKISDLSRAANEAKFVLTKYPDHPEAAEILDLCESAAQKKVEMRVTEPPSHKTLPVAIANEDKDEDGDGDGEEASPAVVEQGQKGFEHWNTITMAEICASQGNIAKAREIYNNILLREPKNERARIGLQKLMSGLSSSSL